jgi:hypothetical protein
MDGVRDMIDKALEWQPPSYVKACIKYKSTCALAMHSQERPLPLRCPRPEYNMSTLLLAVAVADRTFRSTTRLLARRTASSRF